MREYWIPALISSELPSPDCPPIRLRLLGENLIAFRVTSGAVGIVANSCPHRGASLFFGRNEEEGLRCVYHGWKFDVDGNCVDMPSEPAESNFKNKVHAIAYAARERNGVIWAYMGPRETPPPLPDIEPNMIEGSRASKSLRDCNYMQALEGDIDTVHAPFLHRGAAKAADAGEGSMDFYELTTRAPLGYSVYDTDFGTTYGAYRPAGPDTHYWRVANFLFPFYTMTPTGVLGEEIRIRPWVPIDDEHTMVWGISAQSIPSATQGNFFGKAYGPNRPGGRNTTGSGEAFLPDTSDWLGKWRYVANRENDYLIDRDAQKNMVSFTGLNSVNLQDQAITESMGQIYKRTQEHLGTSDSMIIRTRRRLLNAAKAFRDQGILPPSVDHPEVYHTRSGGCLLPHGVEWFEGTEHLRRGFVSHTEEGVVSLVSTAG
jgi:phenylpropionate dioxygenase-like ring-hydroxylating dioxygenase large terminal subunit